MPPVTLSAVVDLTKIKMKWKEQYVSEGLNRKVIPSMPKGIYSGLRLVQNISSPRQVEIAAAPDATHAAVTLSATGFSLTYHDVTGGSTILDLSHANLNNQETVVTLSIVYAIGADTTASWIAYPIADWDALTDGQRAEMIVLGTVNVPALIGDNITTSMITPNRRTVAWDSEAPGVVPWSPIVKNPSFEHGVTGSTGASEYMISDWRNRVDLDVNGQFELGVTTVRSGAKSLVFNKTAVGASTGRIEQYQEVPVVPGQLVRITGWIRQLIAPTGGSYTFNVYWGTLDSVASGSTAVTASAAGLDASFRKVEMTFEVPAGKYVLKTVTIEVVGVTSGSTGIAVAFDDFQVFVETGSALTRQAALASNLRQQIASAVLFEDPSTYTAGGERAAMLRYDKSTPVGEGSLIGQRKDQATDDSQPALSWMGRIINLGLGMMFGNAETSLPRIEVPFSGNDSFTLLFESGSEFGGVKKLRIYAGDLDVAAPNPPVHPGFFFTVNARWDGGTSLWVKDTNGVEAVGLYLTSNSVTKDFIRFRTQAGGTNSWATGSWVPNISVYHAGSEIRLNLDRLSGGVDYGTLETQKIHLNSSANTLVTDQLVAVNLGYQRRGPVLSYDGDIDGVMIMDPHGSWVSNQRFWEEDFDQQSLGRAIRLDVVNAGSHSVTGSSRVSLTTNAAANSITTLVQDASTGGWATDGGLFSLGFRMRVVGFDVTSAEMYIGFWAPGVGSIDNNVSLAGAFKIVNGVVSFVHNGGTVVATGVTVTSPEARWFSAHFDPVNGIIQWHISGSGGLVGQGYNGGTYGQIAAGDMEAGDPNRPTVGIKNTAAGTASCTVDYMSAWKGDRSPS